MRCHMMLSALVAGVAFATGAAATAPIYGCLTPTGNGSGALRLPDAAAGEAACSARELRVLFGPGLDWRGAWAVTATYDVGDAVTYNGSSYIAIKKNKGKRPAATGYWNMLAQKGDEGPAGAKGEQGSPGAKGDQGVAGPIGPQGPEGAQGREGAQGEMGAAGAPGAEGPAGPAGAAGTAPITAFASIRHELTQANTHLRFDLFNLAARQIDHVCFVSGSGSAQSPVRPPDPVQPLEQGNLGRADLLSLVNAGGATGEIFETGSGFPGEIYGHGGTSGPNFSTIQRFRWRAGHNFNLKYNFWRFSSNSYIINATASVICFPRNADNEW